MPRRQQTPCHHVQHCLSGLAALIGLIIIIITAVHLDQGSQCYLNGNLSGNEATCNYVYAVVAISWACSIWLHLLQICTWNMCGLGNWADALLALLLCLWWAVACGVVGVQVGMADGRGRPEENWRHAVLIMMWIEFFCFLCGVIGAASRNAMRRMVVEQPPSNGAAGSKTPAVAAATAV